MCLKQLHFHLLMLNVLLFSMWFACASVTSQIKKTAQKCHKWLRYVVNVVNLKQTQTSHTKVRFILTFTREMALRIRTKGC